MRFRKFLEMHNVKYDFSSTHIDVPEPLAGELVRWSKENISDSDIFVSLTDPSFGREDEMHVTVLYGIHSDGSEQTQKVIKGHQPVHAELGEVDVFPNEKFDVVVVKVNSPELHELNEKLEEKLEFTNKYKKYRPHVTLAYVKKGRGWKYHGSEVWKGRKFKANYLVFSSTKGTKEKLPLG